MSVEITLHGQSKRRSIIKGGPADIDCKKIGDWLQQLTFPFMPQVRVDPELGVSALLLEGEDRVIFAKEGPNINFQARTSSGGPGYHKWLCELLKKMGRELQIVWKTDNEDFFDETGYWESEKISDLEYHMTGWFKMVMNSVLEQPVGTQMALNMGLHKMPKCPAKIWTPLGPKDIEWVKKAAETGDGSDFWIWPDYEIAPKLFVSIAKAVMWNDIRWREPISENEFDKAARVHVLLGVARQFEPEIPVPIREWMEIREIVGAEPTPELLAEAKLADGPLVGYHRFPCTYNISTTWSVTLDGDMSNGFTKENRFEAQNETAYFGLTPYELEGDFTEFERREGEELPLPSKDLQGSAAIRWIDEGPGYWFLSAVMGAGPKFAIVTVTKHGKDSKQWAIDTFNAIRFQKNSIPLVS